MKKFTLIIIAIMLFVSLTSCSKEETGLPEGMALLDNEAVDYLFYYPEGWIADRNDGMVSAYVSDKDRSNVSVTTFAASADVTSVEGYLSMGDTTYFDNMRETFPDLEMLSEGEEISLGGVPAKQYVFTATVAGELYKFRQVIAYRYGYIYMMTYTSTADGFDTHTDEVNSIVKEFKFK